MVKEIFSLEPPQEFRAGEGKFAVRLTVHETAGNGLCCVVTGGELAHIGGVAACYRENAGAAIRGISFPTHKDEVLARQLAQMLYRETGQDTVVAAGLHVDHADGKDIQTLCRNAFAAAVEYLYRKETPK